MEDCIGPWRGGRAAPTYDGLVDTARQAPVNGMDETGWKVGGRLQWLHVAVSAQVTVYAILPGRGYEQSVKILGAQYDGFLIQRRLGALLSVPVCVPSKSCLAHLPGAAARWHRSPRRRHGLSHGLWSNCSGPAWSCASAMRRARSAERGMRTATGKLEAQLDRMLEARRRNAANRRLARHLEHEQLWLFTFLHWFPAWMPPTIRRNEPFAGW